MTPKNCPRRARRAACSWCSCKTVRAFCGRRAASRCVLLLISLALTACGTTRLIDSDVRSFGSAKAAPATNSPQFYRFERLPSQQATASAQDGLEALAAPVLAQRGLVLDASAARLTVELRMSVDTVNRVGGWRAEHGLFGSGNGLWSQPLALSLEPALYRYTVQLLLRDAADKSVVFESSAQHEGPWSDRNKVLPAVLMAALRDFPAGAEQIQRVLVDLLPDGPRLRP